MAIKPKLFFAIFSSVLAMSVNVVSVAQVAAVTSVSILVEPQVAVRSPGSMLSLEVRCEGISSVGIQAPISITGAPEGTSIEVLPQSDQHALVSLVFPSTVAKGQYSLTVMVGSPSLLVEQKVEIEIRGELP